MVRLLPKSERQALKPRKSKRPIAIDLFAGVGGLSLGFEQAGFDVVAAVEYDPIHAGIHELNFPNCEVICTDVRNLSGSEIRKQSGIGDEPIDVVVGGPPCQGFSLIGHRVLDDPRNGLVFHFLRIVKELKPRTFVMENVPGMATGLHTRLLSELIEGFQEAGYAVRIPARILNAANYGVPQDRRRLFLLGAKRGIALPNYPSPQSRLPLRRSSNGNGHLNFADLPACPTVWEAIGDLPNIDEYDALHETDELRARTPNTSGYAAFLSNQVARESDYSYPREFDERVLTGCLRAKHTPLSRKRFAATHAGTTEPVSRFFKLSKEGVCNTLRAGTASDRGAFSAPRPIHPVHARCISVREAARIHSYPDWFRFHSTIWHGFRQIGNSVPPLLACAVGSAVREALAWAPVKPTSAVRLGPEEFARFNMRAAAAHFGVDPGVIAPRKRQSVAAD